jgi:hypothetical protein
MDAEVAQIIAERNLRQQHKFRMNWGKSDQRDENAWTKHDSNIGPRGEHLVHGMPYGICTVCEYMKGL